MIGGRKAPTFPPDYAKRIGATFVHIDACLGDALHYLEPAVHGSPFASRIADGIQVQYRLIFTLLGQVRNAMRTIVDRHHIPLPAPTTSAIDSCRLRINEAMLAIADLDPRANAREVQVSDSSLPDEVKEDACRLVSHVMTLLEGLQTSLGHDMLNPLAATSGLSSRQPIRSRAAESAVPEELEHITAAHNLGELHQRAVDFARHATVSDTVVGVFGAVGAGKSSLLNSLIGSPLLPAAALPTTAVPVLIRYGRIERGTAEFLAAKPELFDRARVAEFADVRFNPANIRDITRLVLETPSPLLASGVTLIDTPGIDWETLDATPGCSLRAAPWCDLAIVLISATAPLTLREALLVRQLCAQGIRVIALITKIDLIEPEERWRIYDHVIRSLWKQTDLEVPVYLVSTREDDPPWRRAWIDGPFADALVQCHREHIEIRGRQLASLRREVQDALQIRLLWQAPAVEPTEQMLDAIDTLNTSRKVIDAAERVPAHTAALSLPETTEALVSEIAHNAAALWSETHDLSFDATRLVELASNARALSITGAAQRAVEALQARANVALHHASDALGFARLAPAFPVADSPPVFVLDAQMLKTVIPRAHAWIFGRWGFYLSARKHLLRSTSMDIVRHALLAHIENVEAWKHHSLATLSKGLAEHIERLQATKRRDDPLAREIAERLRADIARLRTLERNVRPCRQTQR